MKHIILDLEMDKITQKNNDIITCIMETIEIGAVMLDEELNEITSFRTFVKPMHIQEISPMITRLTGITNATIMGAPRFATAFRMFSNWCQEANDEFIIHTWSNSDYHQIISEIESKEYELNEVEKKMMATEWSDFQIEFDKRVKKNRQLSLRAALEMIGEDFTGKEHDALDDARNTAKLYRIFNDEETFSKTLNRIKECTNHQSLGVTLGSMIDLSKFRE